MTKKRYTKKKISFSKDSHTLPYDKYRVEWVDCVSDSGWAEKKEFTNMKLANPVNEGWLFSLKTKILLNCLQHILKKMDLILMEIVLIFLHLGL